MLFITRWIIMTGRISLLQLEAAPIKLKLEAPINES
jgi:hypothetical protein